MSGFTNEVVNANNVDFSGGSPVSAKLVSDGQMLIGSTALNAGGTHINVGQLISLDGTVAITYSSPNIVLSATPNVSGLYGDGSDGSLNWDGIATILGLVPVANVYTLNRDIYMTSSTIATGVSIISNGFKIYCNGTLTNNGTIKWNGNDGTSLGVAGAAVTNSSGSINTNAIGQSGGAGNVGAGSNGATANFPYGGRGGAGGLGSGGAGGTAAALNTIATTWGTIRSIPQAATISLFQNSTGIQALTSGYGGGGGGGDTVNKGGGGGSGAGIVAVYAFRFSGTGTISAVGGAGGSTSLGNTGGGGGGGGGLIVIISRSVLSGEISGQTILVSGGNGGTKTGTGVNGSNGSPGTTILLQD